ncbi:FacC-like extracellular signaling protein [Streptomyces venezuelae]|nr:FacC-like extracellular signaling protein [Streptomyces venezuelae]QPK47205.1 signaling protein [Streptomyces gardneri]CUM39368.1 teichoic acid biosynthesis protein C [Streptomyces venezuelae]
MPLSRRTLLTAMAATPVLAPVGAAHAAAPQAAVPQAVVPQAGPAVWPAAVTLPAGHRFDLKAEPVDLLGREILLDQTRVHQQVAFDPVTGLAYAVQLISDGRVLADETGTLPKDERGRRGDLCVNQVAPDGTVLAVMYLRGFGHGGGLGVEHVDGTPWLWLETDADRVADDGDPATHEITYGKHIGRVAFTPDLIVDAGSPLVEVFDPVPGATAVTPSLDIDHGRIAVRHVPSSGPAEYRVYDLAAFKSRDFTPKHSITAKYRTQAWCLYGNLLYQNEGSAYSATNPSPGNSWWTVYDVLTGKEVERTFNATALGLSHRETEAITVRRTPAGPQLVFGFATQEKRHMALYGISATTVPWTDLEYGSAYTATDSYRPQYRQSGDRVDLRLRVTRVDGKAWTSGETILTLPSQLRPSRTQGMVGTATGSGTITGPLTTRWEVMPDGQLRIYDERAFTGWIALDAGYFTS